MAGTRPGNLLIIYLLFLNFIQACEEKKPTARNQPATQIDTTQKSHQKPPSTFPDTIIIQSASAVFYNPDSLQLEKIKKTTPPNIFESDVHNCFFQMRNARIVLKKYWPQLQIIETSKARYLLFVKKDKTRLRIDLDSQAEMCGIFLFDGKKAPELIDMMNIDTALEYYFKH
jgi:hypothetical protein